MVPLWTLFKEVEGAVAVAAPSCSPQLGPPSGGFDKALLYLLASQESTDRASNLVHLQRLGNALYPGRLHGLVHWCLMLRRTGPVRS